MVTKLAPVNTNSHLLPQAAGGTVKAAANEIEWIRLPRPGEQEPRTGLTRSVLSRLCAEGKVKSITLRERGKMRGVRLVSLESLLSYLRSLDTAQNVAATGEPEGQQAATGAAS